MKRIHKSGKAGFSLLEVMLAVAILMICSMMLIQGFLSTLQYSNNTGIYARVGASNYGVGINGIASSFENRKPATQTKIMSMSWNNASGISNLAPALGYTMISGTTVAPDSSVKNSVTSRYMENGAIVSTNRYAFVAGNRCPTCGSPVYAYDDDGDFKADGYFCDGATQHLFTFTTEFIR